MSVYPENFAKTVQLDTKWFKWYLENRPENTSSLERAGFFLNSLNRGKSREGTDRIIKGISLFGFCPDTPWHR